MCYNMVRVRIFFLALSILIIMQGGQFLHGDGEALHIITFV